MMDHMELDDVQIRLLGCLVEKQTTTPDNYPLSTNALVNACNQSSNRDPVVAYDERTVNQTMLELRAEGLARTITGGRTDKHRHVLDEAWSLSPAELAVLAVLFLRGPQTIGELRTRTERMHGFDDLNAVERTLDGLANYPDPFVEHQERRPGQKERRWSQLVGMTSTAPPEPRVAKPTVAEAPIPAMVKPSPQVAPSSESGATVIEQLVAEVKGLRADVDRLYELLGESRSEPQERL